MDYNNDPGFTFEAPKSNVYSLRVGGLTETIVLEKGETVCFGKAELDTKIDKDPLFKSFLGNVIKYTKFFIKKRFGIEMHRFEVYKTQTLSIHYTGIFKYKFFRKLGKFFKLF